MLFFEKMIFIYLQKLILIEIIDIIVFKNKFLGVVLYGKGLRTYFSCW